VILVDAGDLLQGNPFTYVAARITHEVPHPVIAAMNAMHYDAAAIGNHEFNYGVPLLNAAIARARFPFLAANVYTAAGRRAYAPYRIVRRGGVKVGIIGATTPGSMIWDRANLSGRLVIRDIVPEVRRAVREIRSAGADVVVVVMHAGLDEPASYDTVATGLPSENVAARVAKEVPGIDLIVYGHSHKQMADTTIGTTMLMQPKNWATSVGVAHLTLRRDGDHARWHVVAHRGVLVPARGHAESLAVVQAVRAAHARTIAYVTSVIGHTEVAWRSDSSRVADTPLVDFILEVERRTTHADLASTAAFSLDASLAKGPITVAEVAKLYPYENTVEVVRITGRQLRQYLEYSARYFGQYGSDEPPVNAQVPGYNFDIVAGATYTIDLSKPVGARITRLDVKGRPVRDSDTFTFALNNYRQSGGGGYAMLRGAPVVSNGQTEIRQLLIDEVKRRGTIAPDDYFTRNWSIAPAAAVAPAYAAMHALPGEGGVSRVGAAPRLRIITTNDFHGALEPRPDARGIMRGGAAEVATEIEQAERSCAQPCETLLLDGGDEFQGTPASNLAFGKPVVEMFNALGLAAAAVGNHEFDWGVDTLRSRMRDARYSFLAANVRYTDGRDVEWIPNDTLVERGPFRIGIIGVATVETPTTTRSRNVAGLRFDAPAPIVDSLARTLRTRGANVVVVVAHAGAFCSANGTRDCHGEIIDLANALTEPVDAIVSGHTHSLVDETIRGIPIVQALSSGRAIGVIDLDPAWGSTPHTIAREAVMDVVTDSLPPDPRIDAIVHGAVSAVAGRVNQPVARIAADMQRSGDQYALGNLIADAQRWAGKGDIAVMNNGGIRANLRSGTATYGSLFEIEPFGNTLYRITARGTDVRAYIERLVGGKGEPRVHVSGVTVTYDSTRAPGARIVRLTLADGRPFRDDATYTVVMSDFMATGGDGLGLGRAALAVEPLDVVDLDALVGYLRSLPQPVTPPAGARFTVVHR
jgi:2',3'-cyclic-nucleotide 2'-phosphodiesterase (5'-nucleotidase family)